MKNKIKSIAEIKAGMLVKVDDVDCVAEYALVVPVRHNPDNYEFLAVSGPHIWNPMSKFDENFNYSDRSILEVWGLSHARGGHKLSIDYRELLWRREEEVQEMTIEEIEQLVGKKVKIVSGD